jgi:hypothetical protein
LVCVLLGSAVLGEPVNWSESRRRPARPDRYLARTGASRLDTPYPTMTAAVRSPEERSVGLAESCPASRREGSVRNEDIRPWATSVIT